jgi:hypothetical protein
VLVMLNTLSSHLGSVGMAIWFAFSSLGEAGLKMSFYRVWYLHQIVCECSQPRLGCVITGSDVIDVSRRAVM